MAFEQKDNSGALFKLKDEDRKSDAAPLYRGPVMVDGKMKECAAWVKKSKDGKVTFLSLSFQEPFKKSSKVSGDDDTGRRGNVQRGARPDHFDDLDSDVPF